MEWVIGIYIGNNISTQICGTKYKIQKDSGFGALFVLFGSTICSSLLWTSAPISSLRLPICFSRLLASLTHGGPQSREGTHTAGLDES